MRRTHDCVAESPDQLMFITGDTLILLRDSDDVVIAACEGVVGWIKKGDVDFHTQTIINESKKGEIPDTIISSPTPPSRTTPLPLMSDHHDIEGGDEEGGLEVDHPTPDSRRASGPFDLGTPNHSPGLDKDSNAGFFVDNQPPLPAVSGSNEEMLSTEPEVEMARDEETQRRIRESYRSSASSGLGGIGGFMLGNTSGVGDESMTVNTSVSGLKGMPFLVCLSTSIRGIMEKPN